MAQRRESAPTIETIRTHQDPDGTMVRNGRSMVGIDADDAAPEVALTPGARAALGAIGAWAHMDWDETLAELDRIRSESKPSPPLDDPFADL